jgi:ketosteroid isomerase-like protein
MTLVTLRKTEVVKQFLETAIDCDWQKLEDFCHEKFQVRESDALPYAGVYRGVDGFRRLARIIFIESFENFKVEPQTYSEGDSQVLLMAAISGVGKPTGIPFSSQVAEVYHFEDGLIREIQPFYWDTGLINDVLATGV